MALPIHLKILSNRAIRQFQSTESGYSAISIAAKSVLAGHHRLKRAIWPSEDIIESTEAIESGDSAISIAAEVSLWATTSDEMRTETNRKIIL